MDRLTTVAQQPGVMAQIRAAAGDRAALAVGVLLGAFVPLATYHVAHLAELRDGAWWVQLGLGALVLGGLLYSATTVYQWGCRAFQSRAKAVGFALLIEGVMTLAPVPWLALLALGYLMAINGVATGATLSLDRPVAEPVDLTADWEVAPLPQAGPVLTAVPREPEESAVATAPSGGRPRQIRMTDAFHAELAAAAAADGKDLSSLLRDLGAAYLRRRQPVEAFAKG